MEDLSGAVDDLKMTVGELLSLVKTKADAGAVAKLAATVASYTVRREHAPTTRATYTTHTHTYTGTRTRTHTERDIHGKQWPGRPVLLIWFCTAACPVGANDQALCIPYHAIPYSIPYHGVCCRRRSCMQRTVGSSFIWT